MLEAYSVLTRLPGGLAVPPATAASVLTRRFGKTPLYLPRAGRGALLLKLAGAGVFGGASYDGLVAFEATAHELTLLTLDQRAQDTYRRLGAPFQVIGT
jgi:toxin FitB